MSSRNNQERLGNNDAEASNQQSIQQETNVAQSLNFAVPTEFVDLPSKGYFIRQTIRFTVSRVWRLSTTAKEEDILFSVFDSQRRRH